jgi:hypothetical protein
MRRLLITAAVLAAGLCVVWVCIPAPAETAEVGTEEAEVYEALFRHELRRGAAGGWPGGGAFYLSIEGKDPPAEFMARFAAAPWPVREGSRYGVNRGVLYAASGITLLADGRAVVGCEQRVRTWRVSNCFRPSRSSGYSRFTLARRDGRWVVEKEEALLAACG